MEVQPVQIFVLAVVVFLVFALYKELFNPAFTFFICVVAFLLTGVITPLEALRGFSSPELIIIFLLMMVTAGIRVIFGTALFTALFSTGLKPRSFLLKMIVSVSSLSAFMNNTPIVAFMVPYVKDWAERAGYPSSKFLIPLSYAAMLGGMLTVIGTSTNLILTGLMAEYNMPPLHFTDFLYPGLLVTITGIIYLYFAGYDLMPEKESKIGMLREHLKEYIVETELYPGSRLVGRTVKEAGLRNLHDLFLAEIIRGEKVISPVGPDMVLEERDTLFFSGNTRAVLRFLNEDYGLHLPLQERLIDYGHFHFSEAVIPANSGLIGVRIKDSDFRKRFNASIIAIHRNGKRVSGRVGEIELSGGDFLLLLSDGDDNITRHEKDLYIISAPAKVAETKPRWYRWIGIGCFALLACGVAGMLPLFHASLFILMVLILAGILSTGEIRRQFDAGLLMVLACSLAVGVALEKSGAAELVANTIIGAGRWFGNAGLITCLFAATILLTSLITNPAAVAMMFPIALSMAQQSGLPPTPFFVAIAFAASGSFMTPFGYQTNLMVYGPGGYSFNDFLRAGGPLTLIYSLVCIVFILNYYGLVGG
jgi:di/tricarboxylate transporter